MEDFYIFINNFTILIHYGIQSKILLNLVCTSICPRTIKINANDPSICTYTIIKVYRGFLLKTKSTISYTQRKLSTYSQIKGIIYNY